MAKLAARFALAAVLGAGPAQGNDEAVTVTGLRDPVDKSYRRMVDGLELFEKRRAALAPGAALRFKLLPRKRGTSMQHVDVAIVGDSFETPVEVAPDNTFVLPRDARALKENASVRPNRKRQTMTWRADIRTPGLPPHTRRLGDLRLECEVGMEARLISNRPPGFFGWMVERFGDTPAYCGQEDPRYLFFADRPLWTVTLVSGARREILPVERLYAGASRDPDWRSALPYCDCEVLLDRTYFVPLGDASWPDDTLVEFAYMDEGAGEMRTIQAEGDQGPIVEVPFDSGYTVRVYEELVLLFAPSGRLAKARVRPPPRKPAARAAPADRPA
jgi:hypothetical protein